MTQKASFIILSFGEPVKLYDRLNSAEIATSFGVSRPVVREAFKILEAQGIIEVANGKPAT